MMPNHVALVAAVLLLLPLLYLLIASPAFLLVALDIPQVSWLLRTMFFGYFAAVIAVGLVDTAVLAVDGQWLRAAGTLAIAAAMLGWRQWLMGRIDAALAGVPGPALGVRLRRLHWAGMLGNAAVVAVVVAMVPDFVQTAPPVP